MCLRATALRSCSCTAAAATARERSSTHGCSQRPATACSCTTRAAAARAQDTRTQPAGNGTATSAAPSPFSQGAVSTTSALLGLSTGAEAVVTEAASDKRVEAVVADGLQARTAADASHLLLRRSDLYRAQLRRRGHRDPARTRRNATETIDRCGARGSADATAAANRHHRVRARNRPRLHARHKGAALGTADKCTHEGPSRPPDHVRAARPVSVQPGAREQSQREVAALLRPPLSREGSGSRPARRRMAPTCSDFVATSWCALPIGRSDGVDSEA